MATLAAIGDTKWRQKVGPRKLMVWLAVELAAGLKDRSAVEAQVAVSLWENSVTMEMGHWPNEKLIEIIDDEEQDWRWRHAAIMNLAGTKRYGGPGLSESNDRPATYLFQQMAKNGMSMAGYYVAAKTCSRLQDSMWPSLYIMDEWARHAGAIEVHTTPVPSELVGKLLGAAYDRHVREGKVAIAKAFRESPKLQQFLIASPETRREQMRLSGVFMAEGGTLDRRLAYGGSEWIRARVRTCSERYHWLPPGLKGTYRGDDPRGAAVPERVPVQGAVRGHQIVGTTSNRRRAQIAILYLAATHEAVARASEIKLLLNGRIGVSEHSSGI